jgi:hypothetical protein
MWLHAIVAVLLAVSAAHAEAPASPRVQALLAELPFTDGERQKILAGDLVTTASRESSSNRELAITMAFLIDDPPPDLAAKFRAAADYTTDKTVTAFGELHGEGTLGDFQAVHLSPGAVAETRHFADAKPGLDLNLSSAEIAAFSALPEEDTAGVEAELRKTLLARYRAYRATGLAGIAPYARGDGKDTSPGDELTQATKVSRVFATEAPDVYRALLDYPRSKPANAEERFFWVNFDIDDRPTFTLSHRLVVPQADGSYLFADRHYYVSRSHNDLQIVAGVFPVEEGALILYSNRTVTDQLGGFGASTKQALGRKIMGGQIAALFEAMRTRSKR